MMFVDASAIVAIVTREPDAEALASALEKARGAITSPLAVFEAALGIRRKQESTVAEAAEDVSVFLAAAEVRCVEITPAAGELALQAFARFGKGTGHPARLNLGDCFAYAVAKRYDVEMLFVGEDFSKTDIRPALP